MTSSRPWTPSRRHVNMPLDPPPAPPVTPPDPPMPPAGKKVPPELIAVVERWVNSGAHVGRTEPEKLPPGIGLTQEERAYWFFQPLRRPPVPRVAAIDRVRTPIDAFVLAKLEAKR